MWNHEHAPDDLDAAPEAAAAAAVDAASLDRVSAASRRPGPVAAIGLAAACSLSALAVGGVALADRGGEWGHHRDGRGWWGLGGLLVLLSLVAATATLTSLLIGRRSTTAAPAGGAPVPPPASAAPQPGPLAGAESILAERLARGEISPDDYRASVAALRGQTSEPPQAP